MPEIADGTGTRETVNYGRDMIDPGLEKKDRKAPTECGVPDGGPLGAEGVAGPAETQEGRTPTRECQEQQTEDNYHLSSSSRAHEDRMRSRSCL